MLPPFTDIRSVQTLVDGDKLPHRATARRTSRRTTPAPTPARSSGVDAGQARLHLRRRRPQRAARSTTTRTTRWSTPRCKAALPARPVADPVRRRARWRSARRAGTSRTRLGQLDGGARRASPPSRRATIVVAYEPVWAIGTGEVATPEDAQEVCAAIRDPARRALLRRPRRRRPRALRRLGEGGQRRRRSWPRPDVDGALVGGASIDPEEFVAHRPVPYRDRAAGRLT